MKAREEILSCLMSSVLSEKTKQFLRLVTGDDTDVMFVVVKVVVGFSFVEDDETRSEPSLS
jgi:hypothetical protein